ncbi:PAS domain S-box protein [bacterium]|nr:PAS domain S-box protein [bacterium]MBU1753007.1 PAS domain S-box protein [bacterium]
MSEIKRILLVEDNPDDVIIVKRVLSKTAEEFVLEVAITGKEGIEKLKSGNFNCLILDYMLPDTNALEFLQEKEFSHIPTIILTGLSDGRLLAGALKLGAVNFLVKDEICGDVLPNTILNAISSKQKSQFLEQRREHIYEGLMESMGQGLFALDLMLNIVFTNRRIAEILGYQEFELLGKPVLNLIDEKDMETFRNEYSKIKSGQRTNFEIILTSKTKNEIPVLINQTPLFDNNGVFNGSLCLVADTTNLKEMEKKLRETERLTMMTQIVSEAAHEIRNPLTVIKSGLYLLKTSLPEGKDISNKISIIDRAVERVAVYIDDLLNLARSPSLTLKTVSIDDIIEESLLEIPIDILSNIELIKELKDCPLQVNVDEERLKRVFVNLIKNASEAMHGKGKLRIAVCKVQIKEKEFVRIIFEDSGHGISEKDLNKIFDPFYTTKTKGIGIGLVICKRIIDAHYGNIEVKSTVDVGTTFIIQLPISNSGGRVLPC